MGSYERAPTVAYQSTMRPSERRPSPPHLPVNLASNNPFRNRALSPSSSSTRSANRPDRPRSTNPFLDEIGQVSPTSEKVPDLTGNASELFENLSLQSPSSHRPIPLLPDKAFQKPPLNERTLPVKERLSRRDDDLLANVFADPPIPSKKVGDRATRDKGSRRPHRRNSESSIVDRTVWDNDDERRRQERRHRERDERHTNGKSRSSHRKPNSRLDVIDKLDVTGIYGTGMFHHDGPFDACNPHRNRKGLRTAPMQAFPKDSSNMALGGSGPVRDNIDLNLFHGTGAEGWNDYAASGLSETRKSRTTILDPTSRIEPIHGAESMGLGTSTFLEGAPASRAAIQRRESEHEAQLFQNGGLQRKKSLAQRIRGMNSRRADGHVVSPEPQNRTTIGSSHSASSRLNERNPFVQDYDEAWDKKSAKIQQSEEVRGSSDLGRSRSGSNPKHTPGLERRQTSDRVNAPDEIKPMSGGFINRMKSLRKPRPERRVSNE